MNTEEPELGNNIELNIEQILQSERAWEYVLLDIVKSEELDPWDIDVTKLTQKYLERIKKMKELDLRIPARLILAASILLKLQSDQLVQTEKEEIFEDLLFDMGEGEIVEKEEDEVPLLDLRIRRKPQRKVTLDDLLRTLQKSMIPKERKQRVQPFIIEFPETDINEQIELLYKKIIKSSLGKIPFSDLIKKRTRDEVIDTLLPLLYLANDRRIDLEQENFFQELFVLPKAN